MPPGIGVGAFSAAGGSPPPPKCTARSLSVIKKEFGDYYLVTGHLSVDLDGTPRLVLQT